LARALRRRLAKALTAYGRIVKTIYILRYIQDEKLRRAGLSYSSTREAGTPWHAGCSSPTGGVRDADLNENHDKTVV